MQKETFDVKIKNDADYQVPWEEIQAKQYTSTSANMLERILTDMANNTFNEIYEIRWNRTGSLQGHYVPGSKAR